MHASALAQGRSGLSAAAAPRRGSVAANAGAPRGRKASSSSSSPSSPDDGSVVVVARAAAKSTRRTTKKPAPLSGYNTGVQLADDAAAAAAEKAAAAPKATTTRRKTSSSSTNADGSTRSLRDDRTSSGGGFAAEATADNVDHLLASADYMDFDPDALPRKTKIVCTIGPTSNQRESLFALADAGMNVARLNMSHGDHASHKAVVDLVKEYNALGRGCLAIMLDTKGPEVRSGDLVAPIEMREGDRYTFTIDEGANGTGGRISVNYDGFIDDVSVGDTLLVDGGMQSLRIVAKTDRDVECEVVDGGMVKSRRHLNIRGKSANLPAITDKDWLDLKFGIDVGVDYYALSFVRNADVIYELKSYLAEQGAKIGVLAKIESADSVDHLEEILDAVDGAMVARGDLGAELPVEEVPFWQSRIVQGCRKRGKPVIVATNMLESMIQNPTPTRAEVSDISIAVREGADAVMLSGETAFGSFPHKAVSVMRTVATRTERAMRGYAGTRRYGSEEAAPIDWIVPPTRASSSASSNPLAAKNAASRGGGRAAAAAGTSPSSSSSSSPSSSSSSSPSSSVSGPGLSEMFAYHATTMANTIRTSLVVFSRQGNMPVLLSHYRPDFPIYAFVEDAAIQRKLALYSGVTALKLDFGPNADDTFDAAIAELKSRGLVEGGQQVAIVQSGRQPIWRSASTHAIQVRRVPRDARASDED